MWTKMPDCKLLYGSFVFVTKTAKKIRSAVRMSVRTLPEEDYAYPGPLLPHQIAMVGREEPRTVLEPQECSLPVPTTAEKFLPAGQKFPRGVEDELSGRVISPKADLSLFSHWIERCGTLHGELCSRPILSTNHLWSLKDLLVIDVDRACVVAIFA
jgi:hypothetical protein